MYIRKTTLNDVSEAARIYEQAREFMRLSGNPSQWIGRPNAEDIRRDVESGDSYVCLDTEEIVGVFFFKIGPDPTYAVIEDGEWISTEPYGVIHRIAVKHRGRRIADFIYNYAFNLWQNIRIDTHRDNLPMQKSLAKNGFRYCGIIHLENGEERLAYQKTE